MRQLWSTGAGNLSVFRRDAAGQLLPQVRTWSQFQADFRTDYASTLKPLSAFRLTP